MRVERRVTWVRRVLHYRVKSRYGQADRQAGTGIKIDRLTN